MRDRPSTAPDRERWNPLHRDRRIAGDARCTGGEAPPADAATVPRRDPRLARISQVEEPEFEELRFALGGDEVVRYTSLTRDSGRQIQRARMRYEQRTGGQVVRNEVVEIVMRWFYRFEIEHLIARAGFELVALYGDFERSAFTSASPAIIAVAR
jgi:hypothetical protein